MIPTTDAMTYKTGNEELTGLDTVTGNKKKTFKIRKIC